MTYVNALRRTCLSLAAISLAAMAPSAFADTGRIEQQRELFKSVFDSVERGDWSAVETLSAAEQQLLQKYVLWPDLRAIWLRKNLRSVAAAEIESFLQQHGALRSARDLRYGYALDFVKAGNLPAFLRIYEQFYQGQNIARLDCLALQAEIEAKRHKRVRLRAIDLWLVGKSQVEECDPVFRYLADRNLLDANHYRQRYDIAIQERNFSLARWLAKSIDPDHVAAAIDWQKAQANPEDFLTAHLRSESNAVLREQLVYAAERLTYRDPDIAYDLWSSAAGKHPFSTEQRQQAARHIALWTARDNLIASYARLTALPAAVQDQEVLRWRSRTSLREARWTDLLDDIALMNATERQTDEWRYWRAIALQHSGQHEASTAELEDLARERSYYGFLAADELGIEYALDRAELQANEAKIAVLAARPDVIRARELFFVGLDGRGRSEWDVLLHLLPDEDKMQAAILADRWGWHSRAIAAAASIGEYDDLSIRYPLPYQKSFEEYSSRASIASTWAYGIARSESLFMRDVRSRAGAIGLMQLMPATGRDVARKIKLPYSGLPTLVDPVSNIHLGTTYLSEMAARYDGNQVPATAAYNAGPRRVDGWLPQDGAIDARVWIENIPFNETRQYVKRVLAAQAIFHWRMTGDVRRLSDQLLLVQARSKIEQVARR